MKKAENHRTDICLYKFPVNLDKLINSLSDNEDFVKKHNARISLVKMGKKILPKMHKLLSSENSLIRIQAAKIVELIADIKSIPYLIVLLDDMEFDIRWIAAEGLIKIGRLSISPLLKAIRDGKSSLLFNARAHHVLSSLLYEKEKKKLDSLMLCLEDHHQLNETAPVEALRALKIIRSCEKHARI